MKKFISAKLLAIIVVAIVLGFFNLPGSTQKTILPFLPESFTKTKIHLGLDLQGGSQLDYKIDLRKVQEADKTEIISGVREVIEKRVNGLGVAEPNIYISELAGETHIIVELAETAALSKQDVSDYLGSEKAVADLTDDEKKKISLEKAKATVGKTIQLEFKEPKDSIDPKEAEKIKANAQATLDRIKNGESFAVVAQEEQQAYPGKVIYNETDYVFADKMPTNEKDIVTKLKTGDVYQQLAEIGGAFTINEAGEAVQQSSLAIITLVDKKEEIKAEKEVYVGQILVSFKDAEGADSTITRSKKEALARINEAKKKLESGKTFAELAKEYSDDTATKENGGNLETPVVKDSAFPFDFEQAALKLEKDKISNVVETPKGYYLIKGVDIKTNVKDTQYKYATLTFSTLPDQWKDTGLNGKHFTHADVQLNNQYQTYVSIQFNEEGAKLFEEITKRNVGKQVAIFVGGENISSPTVQEAIAGGSAQITGNFTPEEAKTLARDLNTGAIPAPIILTGEYTIGATLGHEALTKSINAGLLGLLLVMLFMVWKYRFSGLIASVALIIYATILIFLIKSELHIGISLLISIGIFMYMIKSVLSNQDSGWEKFLSFILSCFAFFFITFVLKTGIVLTLAGIAGLILSIGMAVDANILIFERMKEELAEGKSFSKALEDGFNRAWTAIRDSNFSTLLTCAILFQFGSSIIKGFAFNLAAGVIVSMFTAIVVTKALIKVFGDTKLTKNQDLFIGKIKESKEINFVKHSNIFLSISGLMVTISVLAIAILGLNLGIDFKGGSLMDLQFSDKAEKTQIQEVIKSIGEEALTGAQVIESKDNNFIIKTKYLSNEIHDKLISALESSLPKFTENRFTTIGPVIGATLLKKALIAIVIAIVMIILYIGFVFRKVPKNINPWRFGACAIITLIHDVVIVTGIFAIISQFLNVEIDALFITALLTVFGYSVNDTIIIFDRLRENLITHSKSESLESITDISLNQTLERSLNTAGSTLITLIAILIWGSPSIFYFILALTIGITVGTYSSIFTASPLLVIWKNWADKRK